MKKFFLIILWCLLVIYFSCNLIKNTSNVDNPTLIWESHLFYIFMLGFFSFPLGGIFIIISLVAISFVQIDISNMLISIYLSIISTFGFYIQWYKIYPILKEYIKDRL